MTGTSDLNRFTARAYLTSHSNLDAQILDAGTAIERGRYNFGSLLGGAPR
jgi:hypothetical protein